MMDDRQRERMNGLALLKLLALGNLDIEAGRTRPLREVASRLRAKSAAL